MKIVITGGLGYIGTELCKLYSGESRFKEIVVIDKRFVSERVAQLRNWGITFFQGSILDPAIEHIVKDADVVIHLAGITDVAYVKPEDPVKEKEITETAVEGTRNIIKWTKPTCRLIFPSTHVVYEGLKETRENLTEADEVCPVLTYATGKVQSEKDLYSSDKNFVILRLASVYGYSGDTMRMSIMPNLFAKIASLGGTISLFSGGVQLKSLVPLLDVVRCMKFMAESDINRETFHLSKDSVAVEQVALLCKKFAPSLKIIKTQDEIPNLGYTISNEKLLATGFKFLYSLESAIGDMISKWSVKKKNEALEYIDVGGNCVNDSRGVIRNYELTEPINLIGYIESKTGTVRANHYHPVQEQKCLLIKGQYISVIRDLSIPNGTVETRLINEGDIAIIKPNVAHTMVFIRDSIFLNLVNGEREHDNYGITHTIPYILVDEKLRQFLMKSYKTECRACHSNKLEGCISLGMSPLANGLTESKDSDAYPLEMKYCPMCHNCQLSVVIPPEKMFDNYLYVSSTNETFVQHFQENAAKYIKEYNLTSDSLVIDIGSNDGVALRPLVGKCRVLGIEPAQNLAKLANSNGVPTMNSYFTEAIVSEVLMYGKADLVTASNVFAHSDKLEEIAKTAFKILKSDGDFVVEVQYLLDTIEDLTFDNIYHEHTNYWSVTSLHNFFNRIGFCLYKVEYIDTHGGSIRAYISRYKQVEDSVVDALDNEKASGLLRSATYTRFGKKVYNLKKTVRTNLDKLKAQYPKIVAYGSPAKATTALNFFGITSDDIECTIEDNALKVGKFIPGTGIPVKGKGEVLVHNMNIDLPDLVIVLAWNFFDSIVKANKQWIDAGVKFINIKDLQCE